MITFQSAVAAEVRHDQEDVIDITHAVIIDIARPVGRAECADGGEHVVDVHSVVTVGIARTGLGAGAVVIKDIAAAIGPCDRYVVGRVTAEQSSDSSSFVGSVRCL